MRQNIILRKQVVVAFCVAGLAGCNSAGIQTPTLTELRGEYIESYSAAEVKDAFAHPELYKHPKPIDPSIEIERFLKAHRGAKTDAARNHVQDMLMLRSDQICTAYQTRLIHAFVTGNAAVKIGESLLKLVLSPLTLASTTFQAASGSISSNLSTEVLQHVQFQDVNQRIIVRRDKMRTDIHVSQQLPVIKYSVSRAIYDAELYHSVCNYATQSVTGPAKPVAESEKKPTGPTVVPLKPPTLKSS
jgi:hypothetical protein